MSCCLSTWLGGEAGALFEDGAVRDPEQVRPVQVQRDPEQVRWRACGVRRRHLGEVLRRTYAANGLPAVCGAMVIPVPFLPLGGVLCRSCTDELPENAVPRPALGNALLREMSSLYPESAR